MDQRGAEGVLLTGVYGSGKTSVAEEIAYLLEQRGETYALLDLDFLSWAGEGAGVEDVTIGNDRAVGLVAREVMTFLGWA